MLRTEQKRRILPGKYYNFACLLFFKIVKWINPLLIISITVKSPSNHDTAVTSSYFLMRGVLREVNLVIKSAVLVRGPSNCYPKFKIFRIC